MNCFTFMVQWLIEHEYTFNDVDDAYDSLETCARGNPADASEPFSDSNYSDWSARLVDKESWSIVTADLKAAREAWIASR